MTAAKLFDQSYVDGYQITYRTARKFVQKDLTHIVVSNSVLWQEMHSWCNEHFGEQYTWAGGHFSFRTEEDAVLFKLAWG